MAEQSHSSSEYAYDDSTDLTTIKEEPTETDVTTSTSEDHSNSHHAAMTLGDSVNDMDHDGSNESMHDSDNDESKESMQAEAKKSSQAEKRNSLVINFDRADSGTPLFRQSSGYQMSTPFATVSEEAEEEEIDPNDTSIVIDFDRQNSKAPLFRKSSGFMRKSNHRFSFSKEQSLTLSYGDGQNVLRARNSVDTNSLASKDHQIEFFAAGRRVEFAAMQHSSANKNFRISKNPKEMKQERIEAFFYNQGMEICLGVLYLAVNLLSAGWGAYQFTERGGYTTTNDILRVTLPIARAGGRLVTLNCAILLMTACKYLWTLIRTYVIPKVPMGFPVDNIMPKYHSYVALTVIFSGCIVHTLPQIVNYASEAITMNHSGMKMWTLGDGTFATKQLCLTGSLLTIIFSSFFFTTRKSFRKTTTGFRWFWAFHMCGIASVYPLLILHGTMKGNPIFLYFNLLPLAMYIFDISMRRKNVIEAKVLRWKVHDDDGQQIIELALESPPDFVYTPGQYAELKFSPISTREWHPFTIASAPNEDSDKNEIVFYIKNAGRWTGALMEYALAFDLTKAKTPPQIMIRGPHGAPAVNYFEYRHIVVIGSGVGVTPLLSIWDYLVRREKKLLDGDSNNNCHMNRQKKTIMRQQSMRISMNVFGDSINFFDESSFSKFSGALSLTDFFASRSHHLQSSMNNSFDDLSSAAEKSVAMGKLQSKSILLVTKLESMTVSISLFCVFVLGVTLSTLVSLSGYELAANSIAVFLLFCSLIVHAFVVIIWTIAVGWSIFIRHLKCWLEGTIIFVIGVALSFSVNGCILASYEQDNRWNAICSFVSFGVVLFLQALRIAHVFYMTLKELPSSDNNEKQEISKLTSSAITNNNSNAEEFHSVQGILVNRKYSNMKFAARALLPQILQNGMSDTFSMEFFGTREKPDEPTPDEIEEPKRFSMMEQERISEMMGSVKFCMDLSSPAGNQDNFFCPGRPDWNRIFLRAISKAHVSNDEGESVGVFFCGSPAIAKDLQLEARRVTAQHQFAMGHLYGKKCKCKVIVHSENF